MIQKIRLDSADFVKSYDEYGFNEIVNEFEDAEKILIVTYNISNNDLLKKLIELPKDIDIRIFTNIPGRFPSYMNDAARKIAEKRINDYLKMFSPDTLGENIHVFFVFNNHSKIVATDFTAYVGSANYSDASKNNLEAGIITSDSAFLTYLFSDYLNKLYDISVPYCCKSYIAILKELCDYLNKKSELFRELADSCYSYYDTYTGEDHMYYLGPDVSLSRDIIDSIIDRDNEELLAKRVEKATREVGITEEQEKLFDDLSSSSERLEVLSERNHLRNLINFDLDKRTWAIFDTMDSDGENDAVVSEQAQSEAFSELSLLSEYAEVEIQDFINEVRLHHEILNTIFLRFKDKIKLVESKVIDNT